MHTYIHTYIHTHTYTYIHTYILTFGELHRLLEADSGSGTNSVVLVFSNRAVCVGFWAYSASAVSAAVVFGLFPASPDANFGFLASFWLPLDGLMLCSFEFLVVLFLCFVSPAVLWVRSGRLFDCTMASRNSPRRDPTGYTPAPKKTRL